MLKYHKKKTVRYIQFDSISRLKNCEKLRSFAFCGFVSVASKLKMRISRISLPDYIFRIAAEIGTRACLESSRRASWRWSSKTRGIHSVWKSTAAEILTARRFPFHYGSIEVQRHCPRYVIPETTFSNMSSADLKKPVSRNMATRGSPAGKDLIVSRWNLARNRRHYEIESALLENPLGTPRCIAELLFCIVWAERERKRESWRETFLRKTLNENKFQRFIQIPNFKLYAHQVEITVFAIITCFYHCHLTLKWYFQKNSRIEISFSG